MPGAVVRCGPELAWPGRFLGERVVVDLGGLGSYGYPRHEARVVGIASLWGVQMCLIQPPHPEYGHQWMTGAWLLPASLYPADAGAVSRDVRPAPPVSPCRPVVGRVSPPACSTPGGSFYSVGLRA